MVNKTKSGLYGFEFVYDDSESDWRKNVRLLLTARKYPDMYRSGMVRKKQIGRGESESSRKKGN